AVSVVVALGIAVPLCAAWPYALARLDPVYLDAWWLAQSVGAYFAPLASSTGNDPLYLVKNLPWFAWPALPLVLWTLWTRGRGFNGGLATPAVQLPAMLALVIAL